MSTSIVFRREMGSYVRSPMGFIIAAIVLFIDGLLFYGMALADGKRLSGEVLAQFFFWASGPMAIAAIILAMRTMAEERQNGTIVLLNTSPVRDSSIILGKYLSALLFLTCITLATIYMPLLIMVNGKISMGHVLTGYVGLVLLGSAVLSIGIFASSLTRHQILAVIIGAVIAAMMYLFWPLSLKLDPPLDTVFAALAIHARHFRDFMNGILRIRDVVYYLAVTFFFLLLAVKATEAKRWQ